MGTQQAQRPELPKLELTAEQMKDLLKVQTKFTDFEIEMIAEAYSICHYTDFRRFIYRSAKLELDPLANEIHMEYRVGRDGGPQSQLFVHIDGYRRKALDSGKRGGFSQALGADEHGKFVETTLWRNDTAQPFVSRVYFCEFLSEGQMLHNKMQYHMVAKCGEALAYRMAFPFGGGDIHSVEEGQLWQAREAVETKSATVTTSSQQGADDYVVIEKEPETKGASKEEQESNVGRDTCDDTTEEKVEEVKAKRQRKAKEEKQDPPPAADPAPATDPNPDPGPDLATLWRQSAERLRDVGVEVGAAKDFCRVYLESQDNIPKPYTPENQVFAMQEAERLVAEMGVQAFLDKLDSILNPPPEEGKPSETSADPVDATVAPDWPALSEYKQVREFFPKLDKPMAIVAASWMYEQLATPDKLNAFLISQGADKFDDVKLVAFLSITRHLALSQAPVLLQHCEAKKISLTQFAAELSRAIWPDGGHIADAPFGLPQNLVSDAFLAMVRG